MGGCRGLEVVEFAGAIGQGGDAAAHGGQEVGDQGAVGVDGRGGELLHLVAAAQRDLRGEGVRGAVGGRQRSAHAVQLDRDGRMGQHKGVVQLDRQAAGEDGMAQNVIFDAGGHGAAPAAGIDLAHGQVEQEAQQVQVVQGAVPDGAAAVGLQPPGLLFGAQGGGVAHAAAQEFADAVGQEQLRQALDGGGGAPGVVHGEHEAAILRHLHQRLGLGQGQGEGRFAQHMLVAGEGGLHGFGMVAGVVADIDALYFGARQQRLDLGGVMDDGVAGRKLAGATLVVAVEGRHPGAGDVARAGGRRLFTDGRQHVAGGDAAGAGDEKTDGTAVDAAGGEPPTHDASSSSPAIRR